MTTTIATEKQIRYIHTLIADRRAEAWRIAKKHERKLAEFRRFPSSSAETQANRERLAQRAIDAAQTVHEMFRSIVIPADMNQTRASRWIDLLKKHSQDILDTMIDNPKIAESFGVAQPDEALFKAYEL